MSNKYKIIKLSECCTFQEGYVNPSKNNPIFFGGNIKWLRATDLNNGNVSNTSQSLTLEGFKSAGKSTRLFEPETIAISKSGTIGRVGILKDYMCGNRAIINIIPDKNICDTKYIFYQLIFSHKKIEKLSSGSVQKNLYISALGTLEIALPTLETQKRIAKNLYLLDDKIALNTQTNQTLEQIAQAIFKHWFIDFAPVHAKANALARGETIEQAELAAMACLSGKTAEKITALQHTAPEAYHQLQQTARAFPSEFVESEMGLVPKGWEVKKIDEVIQKIPVGKKYNQKTTVPDGKIPVLDQGKSGIIGYHNNIAGVKASIQDPVIVFANHTCYMRLIHFDFSAIQNVFAFKGQSINIYWLYLATLGKQTFVEYKGHFPDFLIKQIVVPPKELTEIFGNLVQNSFSKIALNLENNAILAKTRDLLLPKLLNGEVEL